MRYLIILIGILFFAASSYGAVELDLDSNGAIDIARGGTNGATLGAAKTNLGLDAVTNNAQVKKITSSTDNAIMRWDSTNGDTPQDSSATVDDNGSINIPSGQTYKINGSAHSHTETDPLVNTLGKATLSCSATQVAKYNGSTWVCANYFDLTTPGPIGGTTPNTIDATTLTAGSIISSGADGERGVNIMNSLSITRTPVIGELAGLETDNRIHIANGVNWDNYLMSLTDFQDTSFTLLKDWPAGVDSTEVSYIGTLRSDVQAQIDSISGVGGGLIHSTSTRPASGTCLWNTTDYKIYCNTSDDIYSSSAFSFVETIDTISPTLTSWEIASSGNSITFVYSENVHASSTANLCDDYAINMTDTGDITLSYTSGNTTDTIICGTSETIYSDASGDTINTAIYTAPSSPGTILDGSDNALASIADMTGIGTNSSTQTPSVSMLDESFTTGSKPTSPSGWTNASSYVLYNYATSPAPLGGAGYSFGINTVGSGTLYVFTGTFTETTAITAQTWYYFTDNLGETTPIFAASTASSSVPCSFQQSSSGVLTGTNLGGSSTGTITTLSANTPIYLKFTYVAGTGSNAQCHYYTSSNGIDWTDGGGSSNGTSTAGINKIYMKGAITSEAVQVYDNIKVDSNL